MLQMNHGQNLHGNCIYKHHTPIII